MSVCLLHWFRCANTSISTIQYRCLCSEKFICTCIEIIYEKKKIFCVCVVNSIIHNLICRWRNPWCLMIVHQPSLAAPWTDCLAVLGPPTVSLGLGERGSRGTLLHDFYSFLCLEIVLNEIHSSIISIFIILI